MSEVAATGEYPRLRAMRTTQRAMFASAIAFMALVIAITFELITGHRDSLERLDAAILFFLVALLLTSATLIFALYRFSCPRCGDRYFVRSRSPWWHNNLSQRCMNCGLRLAARENDA